MGTDIISHIFFAFLFARQKTLSIPLIVGAIFPDLDRLYSYPKGIYQGAKSRTFFQELPFLSIVMAVGLLINQPLFSVGIISHFLLDFLTGETHPFYPLSKKKVNFNLPLHLKILVGVILWVIGVVYIQGLISF